VDDVRQIFVAPNHHVLDHLRIEESFFVGGSDDLRIDFEMLSNRDDASHARQHQRPHLVSGMTETLGVPHPLEEDQRMGFEIAGSLFALAAHIVDTTEFLALPRIEERHEYVCVDLGSVGGDHDQRIHLRRVEEIRIVVREQVVHRGAYPLLHRFGEDVFGDPSPQHRSQHFGVVVDLRTGKIPIAAGEIIAVARLVEVDGRGEIVLEQLDIAEDRLRGAGEVEVFLDVSLAHLGGETCAVGVAVLFQLGNQPNQALQLFLPDGHGTSFLTLSALNLAPMLGHFASKREKNQKNLTYYILTSPEKAKSYTPVVKYPRNSAFSSLFGGDRNGIKQQAVNSG